MAVLIYLLPILIAIGLGLAQFDAGKRQIANLLARALGPGTEVTLGDFSGSPFDLRLDDLKIGDADGVWLDLDDFRFKWAPSALLRGRLVIEEASIAGLTLERLPEARGSPPPEPAEPFKIPGLPSTLRGLAVERLAVGRLTLGAPILGERGVFKVDGRLQAADPQEQFALALDIEREDEPTARLAAKAELAPRETGPPVLSVDVEAAESGGLLATLAGLPRQSDLVLSLKGTAPVTDWRGTLAATAQGVGTAEAAFGLQAAADLSSFAATAEGVLDLTPGLLPKGMAALLEPETRFTLRLHRPAEGDRLVVDGLSIASQAAEATAEARLDLAARTAEGRLDLRLPRLATLSGLAETPLGGSLSATGRFAGPLSLPAVTVDLAIDDLQAAGVSAARFGGRLELAEAAEAADGQAGLRLDGNGRIEGLAVEGAPLREQGDVAWSFGLDLPGEGGASLRRLRLAGDNAVLDATGRLAGERFTADATLDIADLQAVAGPAAAALPQAPRLVLAARGRLAQPLRATITGRLDRLAPLPPAAAALLGPAVDFAAAVTLREGGGVALDDVTLSGQAASLTAEAAIDAARDLKARFALAVPRLAVLSPAAATALAGSLRLEGTAEGPLGNPTVAATLAGRQLVLSGQRFAQATATIRVRELATAPTGRAELTLVRADARLAARTDFALRDGRLTLSALDLEPGAEIDGTMTIDLDRRLADGRIHAKTEALAPLARFFDLDLGGALALDLRLAPAPDGQRVTAALDGNGLSGPFGAVDRIGVDAELRDAFAAPHGEAEVEITALRRQEMEIARLTADLEGDLRRADFTAEAEGAAGTRFALKAGGSYTAARDGGTLRLSRLDGQLAGEPVALAQPATLRFHAEDVTVDDLALTLAGARLEASGRYGPRAVALNARLADLPLRLAERLGSPPLAGTASARLTVTGTPQAPQAEITVNASDVEVGEPALAGAPPLDFTLDASLRDQRLRLALQATRLFETPVSARADLPLALSLQPFAMSMPQTGAIEGRLQAQADLARLASLLLLDDQRLEGRLDIDLGLDGTVADPRLEGGARIADGTYQNFTTGTVLAKVDAALTATGSEVTVDRFTATDGGKGTVSGSGRIDLAAGAGFPVDLDLAFDDAVLVRRDEAVAAADGKLAFDGSLADGAVLSGDIAIGPAEIRIPERLPPSVVDLPVIEIGKTGEIIARPEAGKKPLLGGAVGLRLSVAAERVFVRGRGLVSEWKGALKIAGTAADPKINGQLTVQRGWIDFLDRRLDVTRGVISFSGEQPPSPDIDVVATSDIGDGITGEIAIRGKATSPELAVSSQPALPSDEVLARLLFDRDLSRVTPVQAIKLAAAVNRLRGGSGIDLLGETRALLGVDVLDIRNEEGGAATGTDSGGEAANTTVGVGKYVTDRVFVEVERGLAAQSGAVSVEVEVTPNITVDTEVGADAQTGVGVKWRYDY